MKSAESCLLWGFDLLYYDLHIHSCLSPCADDDMTPYNICAMAALKGLDLIAVTDHNCAKNLRAAEQAADKLGLLFLPGMEVSTREDVHLLCYFPHVDAAEKMGEICAAHLPPKKNRPDYFGRQLIMNEEDEITGEEDAFLIGSVSLSLSEAAEACRKLGGVPVPAHLYRGNGLIHVLGFLPDSPKFGAAEIRIGEDMPGRLLPLHSSDAHRLGDISEPEHRLVCEKSRGAVLKLLHGSTQP